MGVDPGLSRCGVAVVEGDRHQAAPVAQHLVRTSGDLDVPNRLAQLHEQLRAAISDTRPESLAVERILFNVNVRTAMSVAQATGVILLCAAHAGLPVTEYTPTQVKSAVTGHGGADKVQVASMVRAHLALAHPPSPADVADALAVALCHLWSVAGAMRAGAGQALNPRLQAAVEAAGPGAQVVRPGLKRDVTPFTGRGRGRE